MRWLQQVWAVAGLSLSAIPAFANLGTLISAMLALPLLGVAFNVLLVADLQGPDVSYAMKAGVLTAASLLTCNMFTMKVVFDLRFGVFDEVHFRRRFSWSYWLGSALIPGTAGLMLVLVRVTGLLGFGLDPLEVLKLAPQSVFVGICAGIFCAGFAALLTDPYVVLNFWLISAPALMGSVIPTSTYPVILRHASEVVPLLRTLASLEGAESDLVGELLVGVVWALVGAVAVVAAVRRKRAGTSKS